MYVKIKCACMAVDMYGSAFSVACFEAKLNDNMFAKIAGEYIMMC